MKHSFFKTDFISQHDDLHIVKVFDSFDIPYNSKNYWRFDGSDPLVDLKNGLVAESKSVNNTFTSYGMNVDTSAGNGVDLKLPDSTDKTYFIKFKAELGTGVNIIAGNLPAPVPDTSGWALYTESSDGVLTFKAWSNTSSHVTESLAAYQSNTETVVAIVIKDNGADICVKIGAVVHEYRVAFKMAYLKNGTNINIGADRYTKGLNRISLKVNAVLCFEKALSIREIKDVIDAI